MNNITIGRYKPYQGEMPEGCTDIADECDGWIEGVRDDGSTWILFLDATGSPTLFWAKRDEGGGVEGDPIDLSPVT